MDNFDVNQIKELIQMYEDKTLHISSKRDELITNLRQFTFFLTTRSIPIPKNDIETFEAAKAGINIIEKGGINGCTNASLEYYRIALNRVVGTIYKESAKRFIKIEL